MKQRFWVGYRRRARSLCTLVVQCLLLMWSTAASAEGDPSVIFGVISARNSASAAAAAGRFNEAFPNAEVVLRTPQQLSTVPDAVINEYLQRATAVLVAGVFSDDAARLARLIDEVSENKPLVVGSSSR